MLYQPDVIYTNVSITTESDTPINPNGPESVMYQPDVIYTNEDIITESDTSDDYYSLDWFNNGYQTIEQESMDIFEEEDLGLERLFSEG